MRGPGAGGHGLGHVCVELRREDQHLDPAVLALAVFRALLATGRWSAKPATSSRAGSRRRAGAPWLTAIARWADRYQLSLWPALIVAGLAHALVVGVADDHQLVAGGGGRVEDLREAVDRLLPAPSPRRCRWRTSRRS